MAGLPYKELLYRQDLYSPKLRRMRDLIETKFSQDLTELTEYSLWLRNQKTLMQNEG